MRATITRLNGTVWADKAEQVTKALSETINSNGKETAIINVFDCDLSMKAFVAKLSPLVTVPFSAKELVTKKGEVYYRLLLNPSYQNTSIGF